MNRNARMIEAKFVADVRNLIGGHDGEIDVEVSVARKMEPFGSVREIAKIIRDDRQDREAQRWVRHHEAEMERCGLANEC